MKLSIEKTGTTTKEKIKSQKRAQDLSKNIDTDEEINSMTNTPITIGDTDKQESIKEILKIVRENA